MIGHPACHTVERQTAGSMIVEANEASFSRTRPPFIQRTLSVDLLAAETAKIEVARLAQLYVGWCKPIEDFDAMVTVLFLPVSCESVSQILASFAVHVLVYESWQNELERGCATSPDSCPDVVLDRRERKPASA